MKKAQVKKKIEKERKGDSNEKRQTRKRRGPREGEGEKDIQDSRGMLINKSFSECEVGEAMNGEAKVLK